jgi:arsenate reductase-like glutaredoxin family protein
MIVYGLPTCDATKRALKALQAAGFAAELRDVRAAPLPAAEIAEFVAAFGDRVVNRSSTTWRGLGDFLRAAEPEAQLAAQPTLMKRPVIRDDAGQLHAGWEPDVLSRLTG